MSQSDKMLITDLVVLKWLTHVNSLIERLAAYELAQETSHAELERLRAPCKELAEAVARCFEVDPHQWSNRPCQTCRAITGIIGRSFGCVAHA